MKKIKMIIMGIIIGLLVGLWLGINIGRNHPIFSNPFTAETLKERIRLTGESIIEKSGEALEESGRAIKDSLE